MSCHVKPKYFSSLRRRHQKNLERNTPHKEASIDFVSLWKTQLIEFTAKYFIFISTISTVWCVNPDRIEVDVLGTNYVSKLDWNSSSDASAFISIDKWWTHGTKFFPNVAPRCSEKTRTDIQRRQFITSITTITGLLFTPKLQNFSNELVNILDDMTTPTTKYRQRGSDRGTGFLIG